MLEQGRRRHRTSDRPLQRLGVRGLSGVVGTGKATGPQPLVAGPGREPDSLLGEMAGHTARTAQELEGTRNGADLKIAGGCVHMRDTILQPKVALRQLPTIAFATGGSVPRLRAVALSAKQQFATRLVKAMRDGHYLSRRGAASGVDVGPLARIAGVSREMARRYTEGGALPDPNRMQLIADWLQVRIAWLRDNEGDMRSAMREPQPTPYGLTAEAEEVARVWMSLPPQIQESMRALLYQQAVIAKKYPWLISGRPSSENYADFERRAEQNYQVAVTLAAQRTKT